MPNVSTPPTPKQGEPPHGHRPAVFPEPALSRRSLELTPQERHDRHRLASIGRTPVLERTTTDLAFEDAFEIGQSYPNDVVDAVAGLLAGMRAAERQAGREIADDLAGALRSLRPNVAAAIRDALRRGVEL